MNVPDSWVKSVCEKLGIEEPKEQVGVFWDGDLDFNEFRVGKLTNKTDGEGYPYEWNDGSSYEHFKPLSPETIASIKKDLGIE
jgi:hypothetical protein